MIVSDYFPHVIFTLNIWTPELSAIVILNLSILKGRMQCLIWVCIVCSGLSVQIQYSGTKQFMVLLEAGGL